MCIYGFWLLNKNNVIYWFWWHFLEKTFLFFPLMSSSRQYPWTMNGCFAYYWSGTASRATFSQVGKIFYVVTTFTGRSSQVQLASRTSSTAGQGNNAHSVLMLMANTLMFVQDGWICGSKQPPYLLFHLDVSIRTMNDHGKVVLLPSFLPLVLIKHTQVLKRDWHTRPSR